MLRLPHGFVLLALLLCLVVGSTTTVADEGGDELADLSGNDIYDRILKNRFDAFTQESKLISGDRGSHEQEYRVLMHWKSFRDEHGAATHGVLSKTLVRYTHPFDIRHSGYLIFSNDGRVNDQFVYYPSRRRVIRVNLRSEAIFGTDFAFEDVVPREFENSEYERHSDELIADRPVFVVEVTPKGYSESAYSRILVYVDQETNVPLRTRYWDDAGVEVKEMRAQPRSIMVFDGVFVPMEVTMRHLLRESYTRLVITHITANPEFEEIIFDVSRLEAH